jgi:hypothetical protein
MVMMAVCTLQDYSDKEVNQLQTNISYSKMATAQPTKSTMMTNNCITRAMLARRGVLSRSWSIRILHPTNTTVPVINSCRTQDQ